ncbi:LysM peptidoglycan-binding domain-containing protein [Chloracidobacterium validum]|uniref:Peptidoglycan hydrolase n=1 Tax=Chloracidobacterium validum TaxID=2821543 RepID=A0ABX8BEV4_9BACT|nr:LysM peptidoglycan-binding domain-containing protein [Chloracidobacterium validum]QUW04435.1 LysM peptidoglycan-binding domain-containing protein [Chloracidobacterium validum]
MARMNGVTRTPSPSPNPTTGTQHLIRRGETLSGIAQRYGTTVDALMRANRQIRNPNLIYAGQTLTIPSTRSTTAPPQTNTGQYVVRAGDTLSDIAARNGIDLSQLVKANLQIRNPNLIYPGQVVNLPGRQPAAPAPSVPTPTRPTPPPSPPTTPNPPRVDTTTPVGSIPRTGNAFIDSIAADAIRSQRATGVPASVTIAQAILESGWGRSALTRQANNYFGIKGTGPAGSVTMRTREVLNGREVYVNAQFRKYNSAAESFADHAQFFIRNPRYATAMRHTNDAFRFAAEIHRAGYATDPNYTNLLHRIMREHDLTRFDAIARSGNTVPSQPPAAPAPSNPPAAGTREHRVRIGDTLSGIAQQYGTTVAALQRANPSITNPNRIYPGQRIVIPGSGSSPAPAPTPRPPSEPSAPTPPRTGLPRTEGMTTAQKFALYANYIERHGSEQAKADLAAGRTVILGLRVQTNTRANGGQGVYDDRFVTLRKLPNGQFQVTELRGNTEPSSQYEDGWSGRTRRPMGVDSNRDGRLDLGRLVDGTHEYMRANVGPNFGPTQPDGNNILMPTTSRPVVRDTNHDGVFDERDRNRNSFEGRTMYFHRGGTTNTYSAGCQTMPQSEFNRFWSSLGNQQRFQYVLVTVG